MVAQSHFEGVILPVEVALVMFQHWGQTVGLVVLLVAPLLGTLGNLQG